MAIDLDYRTNTGLFDTVAKDWAEKIGKDVKNTQIRRFYEYVLDYSEKAKAMSDAEFEAEVLPFIKMLNSKVAYASTRSSGGGKIVNQAFVEMIRDCVSTTTSKTMLENFKLFFEAVIGFHRAIEATKGDKQ